MLQIIKLTLAIALMLFAACSDPACFDLIYNPDKETCECPPGTEPNYDTDSCEGTDGQVIPWANVDPSLRPIAMDSGVSDAGLDGNADIGTPSPDVGPEAPTLDAGQIDAAQIDAGDDAPDAGPAPGVAEARFPWNGFATGSVHVPDAAPIVNHPLRPKFMWEEVADADHYQIQMTQSCEVEGFGDCDFVTVDHDETTDDTTYHPASSLAVSMTAPVGSRYFWRVRACSASEVCSDWTAIRYLNVGRDDHDYNGDGYADVAVGAPNQDLTETDEGVVYVFFGSADGVAETPSLTLNDPVPQYQAKFGTSVTTAGDVNGDGFADLAVGAPGQSNGATAEGNVFIFRGGPSGPILAETLDNPMNERNGEFGFSVAGSADSNGDGYSDVLVGARKQGPADDGGAFVFLGGSEQMEPARTIRYPEPDAGAEFGAHVAFVGDTNGDGRVDFVVGAPREDSELEATGRAYFFLGNPGSDYSSVTRIYSGPRNTLGQGFGLSAGGGDFDGDGYWDVVISAPFVTVDRENGGGSYVYYGSSVGPSDSPEVLLERRGWFQWFGWPVSQGLDLDGDGYQELVVGAMRQTGGRAHVFSGGIAPISFEGETRLVNPTTQDDAFFGAVSAIGDVNGDGYGDLGIGAFAQDAPENQEGVLYIFHGSPSGVAGVPNQTLDSPSAQLQGGFGWAGR